MVAKANSRMKRNGPSESGWRRQRDCSEQRENVELLLEELNWGRMLEYRELKDEARLCRTS